LAVIRGLTDKSSEWTDEDTNTLQEQNNRMNQIVSYQLQKAAMVGGELMASPINLSKLLEKTVSALRKVYRSKGLSIELKSDLSSLLRMDESDLLEVLGNLIDNACKYGRQQVCIEAIQQQDSIVLWIEDDGAGLEPEQLANMMTRGMRLDQTQEGQGIGLAVVNDIVEAYDIDMQFSQSSLGGLKVTLAISNI
ncbi:MAG: GHKL domain-containing protein, partial [Gammaproteobacteria bacterium]|nr:GHKL domain-containing protein [Gammaproteobacteria bacterium]